MQKAMYLEPVQGAIEDCYLISAMIALAWAVPQQLAARLTAAGFAPPADRSFQWPFHDHRGGQRQAKVSGRLMTRDGGSPLRTLSLPARKLAGACRKGVRNERARFGHRRRADRT